MTKLNDNLDYTRMIEIHTVVIYHSRMADTITHSDNRCHLFIVR